MGNLTVSYGRRERIPFPTPVPQAFIKLFPLFLAIILAYLATRTVSHAKQKILSPGLQNLPSSPLAANSTNMTGSSGDPFPQLSQEVNAWGDEIERWSVQHDVPASLVAIVMQIESCGSPQAKSSAGAMGLFQVMPFHFSPDEDPYDLEVNAARGLAYLSQSYKLAGGSIEKTLAGYNGGHSVIFLNPASWSDETLRYVAWGAGMWDDIQRGDERSETLESWLSAGGESLCRQARLEIARKS